MRRPLRITVITVVVVAGVLVAADYGLAAAAEYQVSHHLRTQLHLANDPSVDIKGFPFITQAIAGDYKDINVDATGVPAGKLDDLEIDADLHDVRVSLSDILHGNIQQVRVAEVDGMVQLKQADLGRVLGLPDLAINPISLDTVLGVGAQDAADQKAKQQDPGNPNPLEAEAGVELTATVNIAGLKTQVNAFGVISATGGGLDIVPKKLQLSNGAVSGQIPDALLQSFVGKFGLQLTSAELPLPFTVRATGVSVQSGAISVQGSADNILLTGDGVSS